MPCVLLWIMFLDPREFETKDFAQMSLQELLSIEVVTATKSATRSVDAPATVYVFSDSMLRELGYRTLDELLETIPEIEIQHNAAAESGNWYTLRGVAGNHKFVVLLNGFRINSPTGSPHYIGKNYSLLQAQRVEIILGPASALYGADAFGGIINIITHSGAEHAGGEVQASLGSESSHDLAMSYGLARDSFSIMVDAQVTRTDGTDLTREYPAEFQWYNSQYAQNGNVLVSPFDPRVIDSGEPRPFDRSSESRFIHAGLDTKNFQLGLVHLSDGHSSSLATRPEYNLYTDDAVYEAIIESIYAKHTLELEQFSLQSSLVRGKYEVTPESNFQNTFTQYQKGYKYAYGKTVKLEEQCNWSPSAQTQVVVGASYEEITALPRTGDLPFPFDPDLPADLQGLYYVGTNILDRDGNDLTVPQLFFNLNYENVGAYAQFQGNWAKLLLTLGLRYDNNTRYGSTTNPRVGVVWKPTERWVLKGLYSEGFLAPSPYEAYRHYGAFISVDESGNFTDETSEIVGLRGPFWHLPNPDLQPEKLSSSEFTLSYQFNENLILAMDAYDTKIEQLIVQTIIVGSDPVYFPDGITFNGIGVDAAEIPTNAGTMSLQGGSLRLSYAVPLGAYRIKGNLSYAYSDGDINGDTLTYSARDTYRLNLVLSRENMAVNLVALHRSPSFHPFVDEQGQHFANPSFTRLDLYGHYTQQFGQTRLNWFAKIRNLLDEKTYNVSRTSNEGFQAAPQDLRHMELGLGLQF